MDRAQNDAVPDDAVPDDAVPDEATSRRSWGGAEPVRAALPASLALLAAFVGGWATAARAMPAIALHLLLFAALLALALRPVRVSRGTAALCALVAVALSTSSLASPVPRAGWTGLALAPGFAALGVWVARAWERSSTRRVGSLLLAVATAVVAAWSLGAWRLLETPGASLPLGHHNLLAVVLVALVPPSLVAWRGGTAGRIAASLAGAFGVAALAASGSLGGAIGLAVAGWVAFGASARAGAGARWTAGAGLLALLALFSLHGSRLIGLVAGDDPSLAARLLYAEAAWRGLVERPLLGWGPGAAAWTLGEHLEASPGVLPPDQVVADTHSLPLTLLYELGAVGCAVLVVALGALGAGVARRLRRDRATVDRPLAVASLAGLVGAMATATISGLPLGVPGPWMVLALVAGLLAASLGRGEDEPSRPRPALRALAVGAVAVLVAWQAPRDLARWIARADDASAASLEASVRLDPRFPSGRWRLARSLSAGSAALGPQRAADEAARAAADARGLAPLWLTAARTALDAGPVDAGAVDEAREALDRACRLSPLGAVAPCFAAVDAPRGDGAARWNDATTAAARALAAEPQLLAARAWTPRTRLRDAAVRRLADDPRLEGPWREALATAWSAVVSLDAGPLDGGSAQRQTASLVLWVDARAGGGSEDGAGAVDARSLSLHAFRRPPRTARLAAIEVRLDQLDAMERALDGAGLELWSLARDRAAPAELFTGGCGS